MLRNNANSGETRRQRRFQKYFENILFFSTNQNGLHEIEKSMITNVIYYKYHRKKIHRIQRMMLLRP